jgi:alkanesulfonate monooxygenase SsuD/methylene tetrahydromethanopterin reductase-like flavin-dependent oxidoreductase (luciferase family)
MTRGAYKRYEESHARRRDVLRKLRRIELAARRQLILPQTREEALFLGAELQRTFYAARGKVLRSKSEH